jgi:hypothetical protein
VMVLNHGT